MSSTQVRKNRKNNQFCNILRFLFCCTSVRRPDHVNFKQHPLEVNNSSQVELERRITHQCQIHNAVFRCSAMLELIDPKEIKSVYFDHDMQTTIDKLDSLIKTLSEVLELYKQEADVFKQKADHISISEKSSSKEAEIEYPSDKGDCHKVLNNSSKNYLPIVSRRSTCGPKTRSINPTTRIIYSKQVCKKANINISSMQVGHIQLTSHFGLFSNKILDNLTIINTDVENLKRLLSSLKGILVFKENVLISFGCGGLKNCYITNELSFGNPETFADAKVSASHFCRFHKLSQTYNEKHKKPRSLKIYNKRFKK
ncbi:uncharacterized protein LOC126888464 isoform X1 [Diabrotica virgifera virgifera]|uniref:Uncharacterized protein n=1 Tax=Diabrotica virgifera virgifera TaxID=50390 RepID=A0ABM5KRE1_DIAVI|nr:uncharacterized protein LOC126888464 isoform X1 [Diabrotica virgifera virgifera]